jgi:hypothetical protein
LLVSVLSETRRRRRTDLIRISVEIFGEASRFSTAICAETIERAVSIARARYPGREVSVLFPIDPETFFYKEVAFEAETTRPKMPEQLAG